MKSEKLYDAITGIDDELVKEAGAYKFKNKKRIIRNWATGISAVAAAIVACVVIVNTNNVKRASSYDMSQEYGAAIEESLYYDTNGSGDFYETETEANDAISMEKAITDFSTGETGEGYDTNSFSEKLILEVIPEENMENVVVSPVNVYMALGMLAEITDNSTRDQVINALGADSIETVRANAAEILRTNMKETDYLKSVLAGSIWLNDSYSYRDGITDTLKSYYDADSFMGDMSGTELLKEYRSWINQKTNGLLEDVSNGLSFDESTLAVLCTTVYFKNNWLSEFEESANTEDIFKGSKKDKTVTYMQQAETTSYYSGDGYTAAALSMYEGYSMLFVLPETGVTPETLLRDEDVMSFVLTGEAKAFSKRARVTFKVPKFDVTTNTELTKVLMNMGITDAFDPSVSDFTALVDGNDAFAITDAIHSARVKIDEEGCEAAAVTNIGVYGTSIEQVDDAELILDRPFLFVIRNAENQAVFVGVVNEIK